MIEFTKRKQEDCAMRVFSIRPFMEAARKYPQDRDAIMDVFRALDKGHFDTPEKLRAAFPSLDNFKYKDKWYVIDIGGNSLRLMAMIIFENETVLVRHIVTHAEYDKLCAKGRKGEL